MISKGYFRTGRRHQGPPNQGDQLVIDATSGHDRRTAPPSNPKHDSCVTSTTTIKTVKSFDRDSTAYHIFHGILPVASTACPTALGSMHPTPHQSPEATALFWATSLLSTAAHTALAARQTAGRIWHLRMVHRTSAFSASSKK